MAALLSRPGGGPGEGLHRQLNWRLMPQVGQQLVLAPVGDWLRSTQPQRAHQNAMKQRLTGPGC